MARRAKNIWEQAITFYVTVPQKTNFVLVELAKDMGVPIKRVIENILKESKTYKQKEKELEEKGHFEF